MISVGLVRRISNEALGFIKNRPLTNKEKELKLEFDKLSLVDRKALLRDAKKNLLDLVEKAPDGQGYFRILSLGLVVTRLGISDILPTPQTKEAMLKVQFANRDAEVQAIQSRSVAEEAALYASAVGPSAVKINPVETALIRRGIVKKDVKETTFNLSPELTTAASALFGPLVEAMASKIAGGKDSSNGSANRAGNPTTGA